MISTTRQVCGLMEYSRHWQQHDHELESILFFGQLNVQVRQAIGSTSHALTGMQAVGGCPDIIVVPNRISYCSVRARTDTRETVGSSRSGGEAVLDPQRLSHTLWCGDLIIQNRALLFFLAHLCIASSSLHMCAVVCDRDETGWICHV